MPPVGSQNVLVVERDAAISALKHGQDVADRRISGLEADLRQAQQDRDELEAAAGGDADFHAALARFHSQPRMRSDYTVEQNKVLLMGWLRQHGFGTPTAQRRAIDALLQARGHAR
jgi:hypothetical protein